MVAGVLGGSEGTKSGLSSSRWLGAMVTLTEGERECEEEEEEGAGLCSMAAACSSAGALFGGVPGWEGLAGVVVAEAAASGGAREAERFLSLSLRMVRWCSRSRYCRGQGMFVGWG